MKIESIIQRRNGTKVTLGDITYHFKPETPKGPHVADVDDEGHAEVLLNIREGYREADGKAAKRTKPEEPKSSIGSQVLQGSDVAGAGGSSESSASSRDEADKAVVELLGQSIAKIKRGLSSLTLEQIDTAIQFESAADEPRSSLLALLADEKAGRAAQ